ncbi:MAG TPA: glycosyltransferase family 87 protein [Arachnia sp.]|nr:glycosyltransferase family 87 protein [Arachnia sp.]HMT87453.1 glycosyltransferase family 87 protein [Arachnia sp.]
MTVGRSSAGTPTAPPPSGIGDVLVPVALAALFFLTRLAMLWLVRQEGAGFVPNDISYYGYYLDKLEQGDAGVMREYPPPAVWILAWIYRIGGGWQTWTPYFASFMFLLDAITTVALYRRARPWAALFWILFTFFNGAIMWYRFDLLTSVLVAWACLGARRIPKAAGAFIGLGAAIKLWPALLIGPLLAPRPWSRTPTAGRSRLLGFAVVGFGLALASLLVHGWERTASALSWQSDRGLHIESVPATPLMFLRTYTGLESWNIAMSDYNALELSGPLVPTMLAVSTALTAGAVLLAVWCSWRLVRRYRDDDPECHAAATIAILAVIAAMMVANKVYSPQYTLWLGGPAAVLLVIDTPRWLRRHVAVAAVTTLAVAATTQLSYPWAAQGIMALPMGSGLETSVLILRNALLVALLAHTAYLAGRATRGPRAEQPPLAASGPRRAGESNGVVEQARFRGTRLSSGHNRA